ncbi:MAG: type III-A CRISPR-associated protein Cas10/Csm1 [Bacteroidales bacterium]|nr:type III-A CRISPR-associated protein Cas10/Csm1 [Bacteroidales bacterium]
MEPTRHTIIELGIKLLKERQVVISAFTEAFSLAGVKVTELKIAPLKSVFGGEKYFAPKELSAFDINYPTRDSIDDFDKVAFEVSGSSLSLLERFGTFVATDADDTIPVYDLFKTVAAIQDCLDNGQKDKPFLLVSADFSGIQDTVYTISSKGALKTLRARSFMLELLTEHIVYEILQVTRMARYGVIYSGGGGFSLLLPNIATNAKAIDGYREVLNKWALQEFSGKFFIALDAMPFRAIFFDTDKGFKELRKSQSEQLDKLKRLKFLRQLDELFTPKMPKQLTLQTECQITRRDDISPDLMRDRDTGIFMNCVPVEHRNDDKWIWVSESCYHQFKLGDKLINAEYVYRYEEKPFKDKDGYLTFKGVNNQDVYYSVNPVGHNVALTWMINSWEKSRPTVLYAKYVRKHKHLPEYAKVVELEAIRSDGRRVDSSEVINDDTATFAGLASSSCGSDLIGALRMDVDDMGNMFNNIGSLTELSVKSRMLNLFFKVYLNEICSGNLCEVLNPTDILGKNYKKREAEEKKGRNASVVYAGGDDLEKLPNVVF